MLWIIVLIIIIVPIILKMKSNWEQGKMHDGIVNALDNHNPQDLAEIVKWEELLRLELAEAKLLLNRGEITNDDFDIEAKRILTLHQEIQQKYNVSEEEMFNYYYNFRNYEL